MWPWASARTPDAAPSSQERSCPRVGWAGGGYFIVATPDGFDTQVGDRGGRLSLGQQQRIAIARAFLKDAPILLLDEPTAALDLRTEADLIDGMARLMEGRTVVIVAHRLSTIRHADTIHVLDDGVIAESGTHDELVAAAGLYAALWHTMDAGVPL